jgi:hypothetical protein
MKKLLIILLLGSTKLFAAPADSTVYSYFDKEFRKDITLRTAQKINLYVPEEKTFKQVLKMFGVDSLERNKLHGILSSSSHAREVIWTENTSGEKVQIICSREDEDNFTFESTGGTVIRAGESFEFTYDSDDRPRERSYTGRYFSRTDFAIYLGLNSYTGQMDIAPDQLSDLRVWPSRYIGLSFRANATLANTKNVHFVLSYGPEVAWHNFMLVNNNILKYADGQAKFIQSATPTEKSKFVVPHVNLPVMLNVGLKKERLRLGVGGYVGYRIGGYTKIEYAEGKSKEKDKGSLGLNDLKYGLTAELGRSPGAAFFIRYDLSELFRSNQVVPSGMQAFSFGIRL